MDIVEFFQQSSGKWFSQRTCYHIGLEQPDNGRSDVVMELLGQDDAAVVGLCQRYGVNPALGLGGLRVTRSGTVERSPQKAAGPTLLVAVADPQQPNQGQILRSAGPGTALPPAGRYSMGADEALTLLLEDGPLTLEERLWFAGPNLRLRTSIAKHADGLSTTAFYSEIRMGVAPPAAETNSPAAASS